MIFLYAQPYDLSATGFYFKDLEEYESKATALRNDFDQPVEEFEIQFIDGEEIDCALAKAIGINQANLGAFFDCVETWDDAEKRSIIIAVGECGYQFDPDCHPDDYGVDIYPANSMDELAEHFVEDGFFGDIPERLRFYIDMEAITRDLSFDFSETVIAGEGLVYACR